MKRDLKTLLAEIHKGESPGLLLLFGDELQVKDACRVLLDALVPESERGFNLERLDGRSVSWDQVEGSINTPPFFPGKKVIWVENAPYFLSREQKGELSERVMQAWSDGKRDDAVKLLTDLLAVEGWSQEQWDDLEPERPTALYKLLDADEKQSRDEVSAFAAFAKSHDLNLGKRHSAGSHRLLELAERGLPAWGFLLMTATQVDRRMRLFKRLDELHGVLHLDIERDRYGKITRASLVDFINQYARQSGKTIEPQAREAIIARAGNDLRGLQQELTKLVLYIGDGSVIKSRDVEIMMMDHGEGWIFDLTRTVAERKPLAALGQLSRLMTHGDHPLKLLGTIAAEVRRLLSARQLLETTLRQYWRRGMTYQQFQGVQKQCGIQLSNSPYVDYLCFQRAERFSVAELRANMESVFAADLALKSSGGSPRLVMERLILDMCLRPQRKAAAAYAAA